MSDPYNLQRFVAAQESVYNTVCDELRNGSKRSHWMWFIFPQIRGLGHSDMAQRYAIASSEEARAYLDHALLGKRLRECCSILLSLNGHSAEQIFGYPDYLKLHSSLTLFAQITDDKDVFNQCLVKYFALPFSPEPQINESVSGNIPDGSPGRRPDIVVSLVAKINIVWRIGLMHPLVLA